jgi:hypothetical protein
MGDFGLQANYPHIFETTDGLVSLLPVDDDVPTDSTYRFNIPAAELQTRLGELEDSSNNQVFGDVVVSRTSYTPSTHSRWSGGYTWTVTFDSRNGMIDPMQVTDGLTNTASITDIAIEIGYAASADTSSGGFDGCSVSASGATIGAGTINSGCNRLGNSLSTDDPGTAVAGNQVTGSFGLSLTDTNGTALNSGGASIFNVASTTGGALSAAEMQHIFNVTFFDDHKPLGEKSVLVTRSATPTNDAMGYTYTVEFIEERVGGDVDLLTTITSSLSATASADSSRGIGDIAADGSYVVNKDVVVTETQTGAQLQGSFQLTFNGYTTGPLAYDVSASAMETALNDLVSISPSRVSVQRHGPMYSPTTQVFGYVWDITFKSSTWVDPTGSHDPYVDGNWYGEATTANDVWPSGYSKAWGKNVEICQLSSVWTPPCTSQAQALFPLMVAV